MKKPLTLKIQLLVTLLPIFFIFTLIVSIVSYSLFYTNTRSYTNNQIEQSSYQCLNNYETFFNSVIDTSNSIERKVSNMDLINHQDEITTYLDDLLSLQSELSNAAIYSLEGEVIASNLNYESVTNATTTDWFINANNNRLLNFFSSIDYLDGLYGFTLSKYVTYNTEQEGGILKLDFDFTNVINLISETDLGNGGHITIYDNNYNVVYCSGIFNQKETKLVQDVVLGSKIVRLDNVEYNMYISTLSNTRWKVAIFTNYESISSTLSNFLIILIILTIVIIVVEGGILYFVSTGITNPIRLLKREMSNVESLKFNPNDLLLIKGNKEVIELSKSFNQMMKRIDELAKKNIEEEEEKRKSELKALQNQINPHFLYNTLDSIVYLIEKKDNEKAEEMIIALSKFFRISISKGRTIIPLEKEIEHVKYYLLIQKIRFGKSFSYNIDIKIDISKYYTIKLILQPLVENAIIHGLKELEGNGKINIEVDKEDDLIKISISDNGFGILPSKLNEIYENMKDKTKNSSVGLKNVYQRLKIYYGEKADLKIVSDLDIGTTIIIYIPISEALKNEEK